MAEASPEIILVDDDRSVLVAFSRQIRLMGYKVLAFENANLALDAIWSGAGCCLIVDLCMPGMSGLELQKELKSLERPLPVIFLSGQGTVRSSVQAILAGAVEFLEKPVEYDTLEAAIAKAVSLWQNQMQIFSKNAASHARFARLTPRQASVLRVLITGASNKEIARHLNISERTVKAHRSAIMKNLEADTIADIYQLATQLGLMDGAPASQDSNEFLGDIKSQ